MSAAGHVQAGKDYVVQHDGQPTTAGVLAPLAFAGYAHFTAMQVRSGKVRGLDLHLERLRRASMAMFGRALPEQDVRAWLRAALEGGPDAVSLIATVYSPAGEFTGVDAARTLHLLVRTGPASSGPDGPLRLAPFEHERALPAIKHVGEVAKTHFLRKAVDAGFDDAAFVDRNGRLSEASIWNLAFWDGRSVLWPDADMLGGVTMGIVRRQLERIGIPQRTQAITLADLPSLAGAAVMNSWTPGVPVHAIASAQLPEAPDFIALLHRAYTAEAPATP